MASSFNQLTGDRNGKRNLQIRPRRSDRISGAIDEPMMLQLATELQQLHHGCHYNHIELEISSPGGLVKALDYCVEVMERLRSQGVTFTTRALMSASSAAANLVSLGDRRETSRTATFLYHKVQGTRC